MFALARARQETYADALALRADVDTLRQQEAGSFLQSFTLPADFSPQQLEQLKKLRAEVDRLAQSP